jgi:hypothetical protein
MENLFIGKTLTPRTAVGDALEKALTLAKTPKKGANPARLSRVPTNMQSLS